MSEVDEHSPKLLLMRHAKSSWSDSTLLDHDRPLKLRGRKAALRMAEYLPSQRCSPKRVVSSSALRAVQTAHIVADVFGIEEIHIEPGLYHASVAVWETVLQNLSLDRTTLIIGHNPGMEDLLERVTGKPIRFPTVAVACLKPVETAPSVSLGTLELLEQVALACARAARVSTDETQLAAWRNADNAG